jgi:hypothetical protein
MKPFFRIEIFKKIIDYYGGSALPAEQYLSNVLQQTFGLDPQIHGEFIELFQKNCKFLDIGAGFKERAERTEAKSAVGPGATVTVVSASSKGGGEKTCFIAMPFTVRDDSHAPGFFQEVLSNLFTPALVAAGFTMKTALQYGSDLIHHTIVNELLDADLALVDLTEHNPNVLFELGMRMASNQPVVLVRARGTAPIFDVDNMLRVAEYDPTLWKVQLSAMSPSWQSTFPEHGRIVTQTLHIWKFFVAFLAKILGDECLDRGSLS